MNRSDIDDTLRDMWATRPRRRRDDKKIGGVAAAIGRRYQIDPTLVRVGFVVATIYGGTGIILYLLGMLLLPQDNDEVSPAEAISGRGRSSMSITLTCVLGLLLIPASFGLFRGSPSMLVGLAVAGGVLYLLHRNRGGLVKPPVEPSTSTPMDAPTSGAPTQGAPATAAAGTPDASTTATTLFRAPAQPVPGQEQQTPPAWDPLGVAPFAWDLPEPSHEPPPPPPAPKHRSAVTPVTIGLALITAGVGAVTAMSSSGLDALQVLAMVLAVLGTGLVIGSFVRGGRGLIWLTIPLALVAWGMAASPIDEWNGAGDRHWTATTKAAVLPEYKLSFGNAELDLSQLQLADRDEVRTRVELQGGGNIEVTVPESADIEATCSSAAGNVECLGADANGPRARQTVADSGEDGPGGGKIVLDLVGGFGNVELKRG